MTKEELLKTAKPILFNTEMVQAILNGLKTTTRRYVKAKSKNACGFYVTFRESDGSFTGVYDYDENGKMFESPQTQPAYKGDILYVRESWSWCPCWDCGMETDDGKCADPNGHRRYNSEKKEYGCYYFKASAHAGEQPPGFEHKHIRSLFDYCPEFLNVKRGLVVITSPARRIEIRGSVCAAKVQRDNMVCLHILDSDFAATVSTVTAEFTIDLLTFKRSKSSSLFSHCYHRLSVTLGTWEHSRSKLCTMHERASYQC